VPFTDEYFAKELMDRDTERIAKEVAQSVPIVPDLHDQTQTSRRAAWLPRQVCRVLAALGGRLVAMGERLEQYRQSRVSLQHR
jgi:hypothetical protein